MGVAVVPVFAHADDDVGEAVVVEIARGDGRAVRVRLVAELFRDIREGVVAVVLVEGAADGRDVGESVVVVIDCDPSLLKSTASETPPPVMPASFVISLKAMWPGVLSFRRSVAPPTSRSGLPSLLISNALIWFVCSFGKLSETFWKDGTTTAVRCGEGEKYDDYTAFCAAIAKRICGSNSAINRMLKDTPVEIPEDWAMKSAAAAIEDAFSKNKIRKSMLGKSKK